MLQSKGTDSKKTCKKGDVSALGAWGRVPGGGMLGLRAEGNVGGNYGNAFQAEGTAPTMAPRRRMARLSLKGMLFDQESREQGPGGQGGPTPRAL